MRALAPALVALAVLACKRPQEPGHRGFRSGGDPAAGQAAGPRADPRPRPSPADLARSASASGRLDLGPPGEALPPDIAGVALGMSREALRRARPAATFRGDVAIEEAPPSSAFRSFSYHFERDRLRSVFLSLRDISEIDDAFLQKARAKWGEPSTDPLDRAAGRRYADRGDRIVSWRLPGALVRAQQRKRDRTVRIYVTTR